jgi:hypothetical protein
LSAESDWEHKKRTVPSRHRYSLHSSHRQPKTDFCCCSDMMTFAIAMTQVRRLLAPQQPRSTGHDGHSVVFFWFHCQSMDWTLL